MVFALLAVAAIGHMVLWVALVNRVHGLGIKRFWIKFLTLVGVLAFAVIPPAIAALLYFQPEEPLLAVRAAVTAAWWYVILCALVFAAAGIQRVYLLFHPERSATLISNHTTHVRLPDSSDSFTAGAIANWLSRLPGNEVLKIRTQEKELAMPRLNPAHDGLRIAHLTDLHMSGRITRAFFEHVVDEVNAAEPDIIAVTGDLVEGDQFLDWIPSTLGRLRAPHGVWYVRGNHDRRATQAKLKAALATAGLIHVGDTCREIQVHDAPLIIAGNELPWFKPAADLANCSTNDASGRPTRLLLAHSPDQFRWERENDIDLMLAGHLHGGQVRLPLLGAITSPSLYGVRYVAGVFTVGNTVLHASRGISSLTPLRYNCPPEIAVLVLRCR
jgi:predicted MPP superfamily phosphohydrolase